ncbi:MAG: hypothetical protein FJ279_13905 [Planctomycetes bacterium]|nr:hypothetical protein [Planctomycetota bacterium]
MIQKSGQRAIPLELREHIPSGCAVSGIMSESGQRFGGRMVADSIATMRFRANGLGGGFAGYGIYPQNRDHYALHLMYDNDSSKETTERLLGKTFRIWREEPIPTAHVQFIKNRPILWRYFVTPKDETKERYYDMTDDDIAIMTVMDINRSIEGAFVASSGKNMGVFKGVGYPEDIAAFYKIDEYQAHIWTSHGRFPTNTPGWWGGAHPFGLLNWTIVHNGEISSYGINRRYLEGFGYYCMLQTDTEAITYLFDLLVRRHRLPLDIACTALAAPFWSDIDRMPQGRKELLETIRITYGPALVNGPFSIIVGHSRGMIGLNDRVKLRPMVAARKGDLVFIASEEAAIRAVCPDPESVWPAEAGKPVVGQLRQDVSV